MVWLLKKIIWDYEYRYIWTRKWKHGKYNWQDICLAFSQMEKAMVAAIKLTRFKFKITKSNQVRFLFHYAMFNEVLQIWKLYLSIHLLYELNINKNKMSLKLENAQYIFQEKLKVMTLYFYSFLIHHLSNVDGILTQPYGRSQEQPAQFSFSKFSLFHCTFTKSSLTFLCL